MASSARHRAAATRALLTLAPALAAEPVKTRSGSNPTMITLSKVGGTIIEGVGLQQVAGIAIPIDVAVGDIDIFTVQVTAQAELEFPSSSGALNTDDVLELQGQFVDSLGNIRIMDPDVPTAFASSGTPEAHSLLWQTQLPKGHYVFRLMARLRDVPPGHTRALLTNWVVNLIRYKQ
jgi:hypothetical protein